MPPKPSASRASAPAKRLAAHVAPRLAPLPGKNGQNGHAVKADKHEKTEPVVVFQKFFKSVSRRTYAVKLKEHPDGNQFLVLNEERIDPDTGEHKKSRVSVSSEDFLHYFRMLHETAQFIKTHPVPEELKMKRLRHWAKKEAEAAATARLAREAAAAAPARPVRPTKLTAGKVTAAKTTVAKVVVAKTTTAKSTTAKTTARRSARGR